MQHFRTKSNKRTNEKQKKGENSNTEYTETKQMTEKNYKEQNQ